jgi:hypothetical protein
MAPAEAEYITGKEATRTIGCSYLKLKGLALRGKVRVNLELGCPPQYHKGDVEEFASTRAALASIVTGKRRVDYEIEHQPSRRPRRSRRRQK